MKKAIALLLVLVLSLCACGEAAPQETTVDPEVKAFQDAEALLEAGEYEAAIAAFSAIGNYQQIADKIAEAETLLDKQRNSFLYGNWKDLNSLAEVSFDESGMGVFKTQDSSETFLFSIQDGIVTLPAGLVAKVTEIDGVTHLISDAHDFVKEENYEALAPEAIELTLENWETYFEIREAQESKFNELGELEGIELGFGVFLREEYMARMTDMPMEIAFKVNCSWKYRRIYIKDYASGIYEVGEIIPQAEAEAPYYDGARIETVEYHTYSEHSPFYGKVAARYLTGVYFGSIPYTEDQVDGTTYLFLGVEGVQGILYLKRQ